MDEPSHLQQIRSQIPLMERVSHDMRSVLASILGYGSLMADGDLHAPEGNVEKYGEIIVRQTVRLQRMVEDMVTMTRIAEGQLCLECRPIHLGPLFEAAIREAGEESGREIHFLDETGDCVAPADGLLIREAFGKLLDNALKFSAPGGAVAVRAVQNAAEGWVEIQIRDDGIGIAESDLGRLFRPFERICNEQTQTTPGNGLGLYIAREIVRGHGGSLSAASAAGEGSVFSMRLPTVGESVETGA